MAAVSHRTQRRLRSAHSGAVCSPASPARRRILKGVFHEDVSADKIPLLTNLVHWVYGTAWGGVYGLVQGTVRANSLAHGLLFRTSV
jgi:squalene cyclase